MTINIYGSCNALGYGIHCQNMVKALNSISPTTFSLIGPPMGDPYYRDDIAKSSKNLDKFSSKDPSVFIFHDHSSQSSSGKPLAVFAIFETSQLLPQSINMLKNGPCDIILTTTKEHKLILEGLNLGKPIHVINAGVDPILFNITDRKQFFENTKFTFMLVGKREKRKNTDATFKALLEECMYKESTIICHTFNPFLAGKVEKPVFQWVGIDPTTYGFAHKGFHKNHHVFDNGLCTVILTTPEFKVQELQFLYKSANVGVSCSSGEGWNLPCILPRTKIITDNGIKNIEDVQTNDKLLTHTGKFKNIKKSMVHKNTQKAFEIRLWGNDETLRITEEHPIYVIKKCRISRYNLAQNIEPEWIKSKDINKGDVIIKAPIPTLDTNTMIDITTLDSSLLFDDNYVWYNTSYNTNKNNSYSSLGKELNCTKSVLEKALKNTKINNRTKRTKSDQYAIEEKLISRHIVSKDHMKFRRFVDLKNISSSLGLYIAEGSNDKSKIQFTIHEKEIDKFLPTIKKELEYLSIDNSYWLHRRRDTKAVDLCFSGKILSLLFSSLCGQGAHNKKIPYQLLYGDIEVLGNIIKWYCLGDGHKNNSSQSICTVSNELANQVCVAVQKLGFIPLKTMFKKISNQYTVRWLDKRSDRGRMWSHSKGLMFLVKNIQEIEYIDNVYNFEVECDNSYTLCAGTVHNCTELMACGIPCITTDCLGHKEFLPNFGTQKDLIINCPEQEPATDEIFFKNQGIWAKVDEDEVRNKIRYVLDNQNLYKNLDKELSNYITTNYTWSKAANNLQSLLKS